MTNQDDGDRESDQLRASIDAGSRPSALPVQSPSVPDPLSAAALDTLVALVEAGPLWDGDVPSKRGRDELLALDYARKIVVKGEDGFQAATYRGRDAYEAHFGNASSIAEARANRLTRQTIRRAK